jgi:signal transduction histidine kinase
MSHDNTSGEQSPPSADEQQGMLAAWLAAKRAAILQAWRTRVQLDPELTTASSLPRSQFNDHIPALLDAYEQRLRQRSPAESASAEERRREDSAGHGLQRWQQGYHLREVTREWGHLQLCLAEELQSFEVGHPNLAVGVMSRAWRALAELCGQGVTDSTARYFQLQQAEAGGHVRDMQSTLEEVRNLDRRRTELFRQAAHDLRGNFGVVANATSGLTRSAVPEATRDELLRILQRSVSSLHWMLDEMLDLARLQAGYELRDVQPFDAAALLRDLYDNVRTLASERALLLEAEGPQSLIVEGDAVKVRRVAQNLLLNALKYTGAGSVVLSWGDSRDNDPKRWMLCIRDTGPGFHSGPHSPLAEALKDATAESMHSAHEPADPAVTPTAGSTDPGQPGTGAHRSVPERGEGIGLSIVKRLCELLDATVELESSAKGTIFRVILPRRYEPDPPAA